MTKEEIIKKIEELESQKAEIEKAEKEQEMMMREKRKQEREKELNNIKDAISQFNKKYNDTLKIGIVHDTQLEKELFETFFPWL